jgi:hypothetical protein
VSTPAPSRDDRSNGSEGAAGKRPWYRRRGPLAAGVVAVLVVVTVVTDLPQHASPAQQAASADAVVKAVNGDIHPCTFAVKETFELYADESDPSVSAADRARIPRMMADDQAACSFTNGTVFALATITTPGSAAGRDMGDAVNTVTLWVTSDALAAIEQIQALTSEPGDATAKARLAREERLLAADRAKADAEVDEAGRVLGAHLTRPALPNLPVPDGTGPGSGTGS